MKNKNILHVIDHFGLGGAQTIVRDLVEKNKNHFAFVLRPAQNQVNFTKKVKNKITIINKSKYDITSVLALKKEIKNKKIDILHAHLAKSIFIVYLYKILFRNKIKVIITEHGAVFSKKRKYYRFLLRRIQRYTTKYIAVSKQIKESLIENVKLNPEKVEHVYNFIDFKELKFISEEEKLNLRESLGLKKDDYLIGFAGRLSGVKHIETIIDSYKYLKNNKTKLLIIGDGELKEELEEMAKEEKNIIFLGFRTDIKKLYQILDLIVLSSITEASPMTFYESQVYGVPFIGSNVYAINEFIKDKFNGLLFEFDNPKDLASKIIRIRDDEICSKCITKNALKNLKQFDIEIYNKKLNYIYGD
ncbi:MAG: glycosyltransferase family 4 protein [Candidatus Woesearchaeota archaeon]|jgi:glycosyltransferase involved in cell wall biosynthesis|nr:glycosyltransferase family 4 protein [Candidatus Woesearchaeota archaeon]